jgi:hypothetical protein
VFLEVVAFTTDVRSDFNAVGQAYTSNFPKSGVRLLGSCGVNAGANATLLRASLQRRSFRPVLLNRSSFGDDLIDRWHAFLSLLLSPHCEHNLIDRCGVLRRYSDVSTSLNLLIRQHRISRRPVNALMHSLILTTREASISTNLEAGRQELLLLLRKNKRGCFTASPISRVIPGQGKLMS